METENRIRKTLYGSESSNTCAFCAYHGRALTPRQMKQHGCLGKQCSALIKHDHPYWVNREKSKEQRKSRRARLEAMYLAVISEQRGVSG